MESTTIPQPAKVDVRDTVIELLADSEHALLERVVSLEADVDSYRLLAQQALHGYADLQRRLEQQQRRNADLREEIRRYTAATVTDQKNRWAA